MRCDQVMGLNEWASAFIAGEPMFVCYEDAVRIYPDGSQEVCKRRMIFEPSVKKEETGDKFFGMYDAEYPLHKYTFRNGEAYTEFVQAQPWSSGPMFFLALKDENGNVVFQSLWAQAAIDAA